MFKKENMATSMESTYSSSEDDSFSGTLSLDLDLRLLRSLDPDFTLCLGGGSILLWFKWTGLRDILRGGPPLLMGFRPLGGLRLPGDHGCQCLL